MSLTVELPGNYEPERRYILHVVLQEFLGLAVECRIGNRNSGVRIGGAGGRGLEIVDGLFNLPMGSWLSPRSVPKVPIVSLETGEIPGLPVWVPKSIPVFFGQSASSIFSESSDGGRLNVDVLGTIFFLLSRYEEYASDVRDMHGRFPLESSLLFRTGLSMRPVVHEYLEVLWACLARLWPGLRRKRHDFNVFSTHDVDQAFSYALCDTRELSYVVGRQVLRKRSLAAGWAELNGWVRVRRYGVGADPANTFDWIMSTAERYGRQAAFYFQSSTDPVGRSSRRNIYDVRSPEILRILTRIDERGHEIGIHPSYRAHLDGAQLKKEISTLRIACMDAGITPDVRGGRHHYLRWDARGSFRLWNEAGLQYDSSVGFAESPGFRCGVCYTYPVYDLEQRAQLDLYERPLILMDVSLTSRNKLGLNLSSADDFRAAGDIVFKLKEACRSVGGEFVVLWHNNNLADERHRCLYEAALS